MEKYGIDISRWQGDFNIDKAKKDEKVQFAIIKIGGADANLYKDRCFDTNYAKCEKANLPKGCYFFGHAMTVSAAKKEVEYWLSLMKGKKFEYPVFYDVEADMLKVDKRTLTNIIKTVMQTLEANGYWAGIYSSSSAYNTKVYDNELAPYTHWVAAWTKSKPVLKSGNETQIWQFGGEVNLIKSNKVNGITVDQNYSYVDYPKIIKAKGLNNYPKGGK